VNISVEQIRTKPRRIGRTADGDEIYEMILKGGLVVVEVANAKTGRRRTVGLGPHRALARHVAKTQEHGLEFLELSKSEAIGIEYWQHLIPECLALLKRFRAIQ